MCLGTIARDIEVHPGRRAVVEDHGQRQLVLVMVAVLALEAALPAALVAVAVGMGAAVGPDGTLAARCRLRVGPLPDSGAHAA